jgi:hypothetical protein
LCVNNDTIQDTIHEIRYDTRYTRYDTRYDATRTIQGHDTYLHWITEKDGSDDDPVATTPDDIDMNGSYAIGATLIIAFAKIYITPNEPHTEPNIAILFVKGHLSALSSPDASVNNDVDVFDDVFDVVFFTTTPPPLPPYGILL